MPKKPQSSPLPAERRKLTPPQYARQLGVDVMKVLRWIRSGELRAFNAAATTSGKPRYLIDLADIVAFEQSRAVAPPDPPQRRRKKNTLPEGFIRYFS